MLTFQPLKSWSIFKKLCAIMASAVLGIVILTAFFLQSERKLILEERQASVRRAVETAHGTLAHYHRLVSTGAMPEADAKTAALQVINGMRYDEKEYFWVNDMQPNMIMHPLKPELDGKSLADEKDPTGKALFVEMTGIVKASGSGYLFYRWPKPGSDKPVDKVSYVKGFAPWGWVIGSGVYIDNVEATFWSRLVKFALGALALAAVMLAVCGVIGRSLLRQLGGEPAYASDVARHIAAGDLTVDISVRRGDNDSLLYTIKSMRDSIAQIVRQVRDGTDTIVTASSEIANGNLDLSSRTEEQASSLEETASSMEELTSTVKMNAEHAQQANQLAITASALVSDGGQLVGRAIATMDAIKEGSRKMADIVGLIDGIAFQTNILALNAAVEAARAGEQGRGFAVVAGEVRTLAQRSASAAKEIRVLIESSMAQVETGGDLVNSTGDTMVRIVGSIKEVADLMGEIAAASNEQSLGIHQVNQAIGQMDEVTQQNAALVEQAASAAESLKEQASWLMASVSVFKIGADFAPALPSTVSSEHAAEHRGELVTLDTYRRTHPRNSAAAALPQARRRTARQIARG